MRHACGWLVLGVVLGCASEEGAETKAEPEAPEATVDNAPCLGDELDGEHFRVQFWSGIDEDIDHFDSAACLLHVKTCRSEGDVRMALSQEELRQIRDLLDETGFWELELPSSEVRPSESGAVVHYFNCTPSFRWALQAELGDRSHAVRLPSCPMPDKPKPDAFRVGKLLRSFFGARRQYREFVAANGNCDYL